MLVAVGLKVNVFAVLRLPLHALLAAQTVAPLEDQVSVAGLPLTTLAGLALIETVGAAKAWTLANIMPGSNIAARMQNNKIDIRLAVMLFSSVSAMADQDWRSEPPQRLSFVWIVVGFKWRAMWRYCNEMFTPCVALPQVRV